MGISYIGPDSLIGVYPGEYIVNFHDFVGVIFNEGVSGAASFASSIRINGHDQEDYTTMTLLIPDRDRENQDDFIWCIPIERAKWNKWYELSQKFKTAVPKEHGGGVRYMNRMEGRTIRTVLMMPTNEQTDEDATTACAYLRMVKGLTCRMYIVRCTDDPLTGARLIAKCAGANVNYVEDVEFANDADKKGEEQTP